MNASGVTLERFDGLTGIGARTDEDLGKGSADGMEAAPIRPAQGTETETDAEADAVEEARAAHDAAMRRAAALIDELCAETAKLESRIGAEIAAEVGKVANELLPAVIDEALAAEIAAAARSFAGLNRGRRIELALGAEQQDDVTAALGALAPPVPVTVKTDPALGPGAARIQWPQGGAEIDRDELVSRARSALQTRLAILLGRTAENG